MSHAARPTTTPNRLIPSPKVRSWLYGIAAAAAPILVIRGLVSADEAGLWIALAGAALGITGTLGAANVPR
ncbi:hypothetical protein M2152_001987 [Microbacteriaceae bacterium SG_E_30_P1]|uniref:Uncharacterized protein n=1 Tax=Antiquaquibacter oligotrophicus TaxID=2880260 RepID=A0ABT6KP92_9MICO|nr:hypothetical protein [Antiquaquibacter oligotrophicus]MDH6181805.1 hypothetical protein [Antiquaquibacter oligotrophicus]UDF12516.1 hypothetical protein LH407_10170 [Antiquaquibacter oligotrophicus]